MGWGVGSGVELGGGDSKQRRVFQHCLLENTYQRSSFHRSLSLLFIPWFESDCSRKSENSEGRLSGETQLTASLSSVNVELSAPDLNELSLLSQSGFATVLYWVLQSPGLMMFCYLLFLSLCHYDLLLCFLYT